MLNANYLKARLAEGRAGERLPVAFDRHCMHEFVLSGKPMKKELGIATLDLAKRLLDFGFHPPTVYFPLLVDEALMVEPTETETKESLDAFAEAIEQILAEAEEDPEIAKQAPYTTPVRRLDEVKATRRPVVRQPLLSQLRPLVQDLAARVSSTGAKRSPCARPARAPRRPRRPARRRRCASSAASTSSQPPGWRRSGARGRAASRRRSSFCSVVLGPVDEDLALRVRSSSSSRRPRPGSASRAAARSLCANGLRLLVAGRCVLSGT